MFSFSPFVTFRKSTKNKTDVPKAVIIVQEKQKNREQMYSNNASPEQSIFFFFGFSPYSSEFNPTAPKIVPHPSRFQSDSVKIRLWNGFISNLSEKSVSGGWGVLFFFIKNKILDRN